MLKNIGFLLLVIVLISMVVLSACSSKQTDAELTDIEKEFLGPNQWNSITYNDFFAYPFRGRYQQSAEDALSTKLKILRS